ncbi:phage major capsid protein [Flexibacterium corallicola]|uniref:phage major capsid protein n=1 Tax=Flexibacterium corallicola TaxID=3037259 RepID=UPI00286F21AC|nr:phage major capsid protein [Pseudovibrio sp. M1P-2-3]
MKFEPDISPFETKDLARKGEGAPSTVPAAPRREGDPLSQILDAFEDYRQVNDERLNELERKSCSDVLLDEKLARMDQVLDEKMRKLDALALKQQRPDLGHSFEPAKALENTEHKSAFESYMRKGDESRLLTLERKAMSVGVAGDGGYMVPEEVETQILDRLVAASPMRGIAGNLQVSGNSFRKLVSQSGPTAGWVGESDVRPETASSVLADLSFQTMELYAMPAASQTLLDDAAINVDEWIALEVEGAFAEQESAAFVLGDGASQPKGLLSYSVVDQSSWSWGNVGRVKTGVSGDFAASDPADALIDLIYSVKSKYRQNGRFVLNRNTQANLRKLKDAQGNYLWQPPAATGLDASLLGFPITELEEMPDMAADAYPLAFGDFKKGYLVVDRMGVRVLRDPYTAKPNVLFYTTKRVGGGIQDFDAVKLLQTAA